MRFSLKPFLISLFLLAIFPGAALAASFEYLYLEASEGNSSGGHSAIQFGDEIYHYQHHDSGLIRLLRQDKSDFHFLYRFLQNRRIHLSRIEVSEETFNRLSEYFKWQFLAQEQQFKQLNDLYKERLLLRRLLYKQPDTDTDFSAALRLNGVGLFYAEHDLDSQKDEHPKDIKVLKSQSLPLIGLLRKKIEALYGQDYLSKRQEQITADIKALTPSHWPAASPILSKDNFPPVINSFADSYTDYLTGLAAIKVLVEEQSLQSDAFFVTQDSVTLEEKKVLETLREQLALSLLKSVNSGRPDWGTAVLVNMARYIAVEQSLQLGRWVFIDDFAVDSEWISADQFVEQTEPIQTQIDDAQANFKQTRKAIINLGGLTESNYSQLEMSANRYFEWLKGKQQKAVRYQGEKALPTKSISLPDWRVPELSPQQLTGALTGLEHYENKLLQELAQRYQYNLLTRNCVTELFRTLDQALLAQNKVDNDPAKQVEFLIKESRQRLGGTISGTYNFIPFVSFQSVQENYKVTSNAVLNAYRGQQLEKLYAKNNGLMVALRESNIFSSTVYTYNPDDAFFVFFTDDSLALRPVFGLFNTAAGLGQSLFGFLSWPFDSGKNIKAGTTGILMSLPELLFFNMRKGSYKYLSYNQFVKDEK